MKYSNKLKLDNFFWQVRNQNYAIIKRPDYFPSYYRGSDIDIICEDKNEFAKKLLEEGNLGVEKKNFEIQISSDEENQHIHLDFLLNNELEFRFDIYGAMPVFKKIKIKNEFIYEILNNKEKLLRKRDGQQYFIYVPSEIDELVMRYIEYIELFEQRPDKIKHYDFILSRISSDKSKLRFLDKLHFYIDPLYTKEKDRNVKPSWNLKIKMFPKKIYYLSRRAWDSKIKIRYLLRKIKGKILN